MKIPLTLLFAVLVIATAQSQDTSDIFRLKQLKYMDYSGGINCDSIDFSNMEHRICLNLKFQKVDSIMNAKFKELLSAIEVDSIKDQIIAFQNEWVLNRRFHCKHKSAGYNSHMLGIIYLDCFVQSTLLRTKEIEYHLGYEDEE